MFYQLDVGIGVNSGECIVGNLGSMQRFDYSVLGDAVNLASRLESLSKDYGIPILVGERTQARARGFAMLELDLITVRGKREPSRVFGLLGDRAVLESVEFQALSERHQAMLAAYRAQQWRRARDLVEQCRGFRPGLGELYDLYAERIEYLEAEPPQQEWHGIASGRRK
jgi:adenylate cyclase